MGIRKIGKPVHNGVAKVPVVIQLEALECGAACLSMIAAYYGKWLPLEKVRLDCGVSRDGASAKNIAVAARSYGFSAKGFKCEPAGLRKKAVFPCIIHWNFNHFVVCCGFRGKSVLLNDPSRGNIKVSMEEFDRCFTGICIMITPTENFEPGGKKKSMLSFASKRLKGAAGAVIFVMLTTLVGYLLDTTYPLFSRFFLDRMLTKENDDLLVPFIILLSAVVTVHVVIEAVHAVYSLKINGKMAVIGSSTYMWKILKMPIEFFTQRNAGDIQTRHETNTSIAETLVDTLTPLLLDIAMMLVYLLIMLKYSVLLTLVGLLGIVINIIVCHYISAKRVNITRVQMRGEGNLASSTVSGIQMIETIKSSGAESGFFKKWSGYQASVNAQSAKFDKLNANLGLIPSLISDIVNYSVLVIGIYLTMNGQFTLGAILAFQNFLLLFMQPADLVISAGQTIQEMRTQMEFVEDVMQYPDDVYYSDTPLSDEADYTKLHGEVELKNVTFGYSRLAEPLIKDFSMKLGQGSRIAFVGASGCGKSTLSKLISGLYEPWSGEILFDGKPIGEIDRSVFTSSVAVVDQDIILFEDTVANNIKMWDSSIEDFEMILAARDAQIHDDIMQRPGGYRGMIIEGGKDLSGGQRQRLEIARVLAQDPSVIIMDEATSALDAKTEYELVKAVKDRGITCIVIAHRLSTIRDCDEIVVLDKGEVVERGTHEELYAKGGYYTKLVSVE